MTKLVSSAIVAAAFVVFALAPRPAQANKSGKKAGPAPGAIVFVIDRSGSMSGANIGKAREAVTAAVAWMPKHTFVSVVAFDNVARLVIAPQRARNFTRIKRGVATITAGGGTNVYPALKLAFDQLQRVRARTKHVVLLSDGQSPYTGIEALVTQMRKQGITVSALAIGSGADATLLKLISVAGNGRFYKLALPGRLPALFKRETQLALQH